LKSKGRMSERGRKEKGKIIKKNLKRIDFFFLFVFSRQMICYGEERKERKVF